MSLSAAAIRKMAAKGLTIEDIVEIAEAMEEGFSLPVPTYDLARANKRARDADRMRRKREEEATSRDVAATVAPEAPLSLAPSPQTPQPHTHSPPDITTRTRAIAKPNGFARFWETYPNKIGKAAAEKAYERALKSIDGPDPPAVILAGVQRAKASRAWGEGFIPHPTTWLNRGSWDDEPAEIIPLKAPHERPDPLQRKRDQFDAMFAGAESAARRRELERAGG